MKKIAGISLIALLGLAMPALAQDSTSTTAKVKHGASKAWQATKKGAKKVGNKTAEIASKGASRITDKKSDEWVGPDGQTIYIDDVNRFYWVDGKGKKIYVTESDLKAKNK